LHRRGVSLAPERASAYSDPLRESVILDDATSSALFCADVYVQ
jgi:hypothetical protein